MKKKLNVTLFVGAGFSAPFGLPTMSNFFVHADDSERINDEDRALIRNIKRDAQMANSFFESSITNLEDVLSFYEIKNRLDLDDSKNKSNAFKKIIRKIYSSPSGSFENYWERYRPLDSLLGSKLTEFNNNLTIITTNYDLNIESACYILGRPCNPTIPLDRLTALSLKVGELYSTTGIPLLKLHGSVNWVEGSGGKIMIDDNLVKSAFSSNQIPIPRACLNDFNPGDYPVIIPPSFLKPDLIDPMKIIWKEAAKALSESHYIAFIGYSFPQSDKEMKYFLATALTFNSNLRKIFIVDPNSENIAKTLKMPDSRMGSIFRELLQPWPADGGRSWIKTRLPIS